MTTIRFSDSGKKKDADNDDRQSDIFSEAALARSPNLETWLHSIRNAIGEDIRKQNTTEPEFAIVYTLAIYTEGSLPHLLVHPQVCRVLQKGGYGTPAHISLNTIAFQRAMKIKDAEIIYLLNKYSVRRETWHGANHFYMQSHMDVILPHLLKTERCHWQSEKSAVLHEGLVRKGFPEWRVIPGGKQRFTCRVPGSNCVLLPTNPPYYVDLNTNECGLLDIGFSSKIASVLLAAPEVTHAQAKEIHKVLQHQTELDALPLPDKAALKTVHYEPRPELTLLGYEYTDSYGPPWSKSTYTETLALVNLAFFYGSKTKITYRNKEESVIIEENGEMLECIRNRANEIKYYDMIDQHFQKQSDTFKLRKKGIPNSDFALNVEREMATVYYFYKQIVPVLREQGWEIIVDASFPLAIADDDAQWYSELEESSQNNWFDLELGITVNGEKVNLLPMITELLEQIRRQKNLPDEYAVCFLQAESGRKIALPIARMMQIAETLTDLYDPKTLGKNNKLRLAKIRALQLLELEQAAAGKTELRWLGGDQLLHLARKLKNFTGIEHATVPESFQANLRPYQQEGVNWLQFLRTYDLNGVLADDMGLGKTVQALASLLIEKESGRMDKPCLVIAPTSLVGNWRAEAKRFAPSLRVLTMHGVSRKQHFRTMKDYDLIITTYPLLARDSEQLLQQDYHYLILDEAQVIKNSRTQATQIVLQLVARHRLCLTGTPMENHLGELWSLFNFLLPGFLGEYRQFVRLFRTPIEKQNDLDRQASLRNRIAPFLLRRTKNAVAKELPPKTEIIRGVELEGAQRDLYESIRIAMQQKVQQLVRKQGWGKSHIVVLDALLKLRQTCCSPQLLSLESAKKVKESAKLSLLMTLMSSLLAEGRQILLFSSFTSMLWLIEQELQQMGISYVKLTGETIDRQTPIETFQSGKVPLFLISLKAGGVGLNLTAADTVIHYDPWWNPAAEDQATDRAHRIGQDKPVFVYKLITYGTVEEKILALQAKKKALLDSLFSENQSEKVKLSLDELNELFTPLT